MIVFREKEKNLTAKFEMESKKRSSFGKYYNSKHFFILTFSDTYYLYHT